MADIKWIKIVTDMFDNRKIRQIECIPDGDSIIVAVRSMSCSSDVPKCNMISSAASPFSMFFTLIS